MGRSKYLPGGKYYSSNTENVTLKENIHLNLLNDTCALITALFCYGLDLKHELCASSQFWKTCVPIISILREREKFAEI